MAKSVWFYVIKEIKMNLVSQTHKIELLLKQHQLLSLKQAQPKMAIECRDGVIWVTCAGESRDYMLRAGRRYEPKTRGKIVIEAIDDARVDIEE
jgi:hypothetical protein